jgi:hypothetical protein
MYKKDSLKTLERKTGALLIVTLAIMIVSLGTIYLSMLSTGAQNGYSLELEKTKKQELYDSLQKIKNDITNESSLTNLETSEKINQMSESSEKTYITN